MFSDAVNEVLLRGYIYIFSINKRLLGLFLVLMCVCVSVSLDCTKILKNVFLRCFWRLVVNSAAEVSYLNMIQEEDKPTFTLLEMKLFWWRHHDICVRKYLLLLFKKVQRTNVNYDSQGAFHQQTSNHRASHYFKYAAIRQFE